MIKAIVFDLDGTLIRLPVDYEQLFREFNKITKTNTFHPVIKAISKLDEHTRKKVFKVWDNAELLASKKMTVNKEGMRIYKRYSQKPKALVTLQGRALVETILKELDLTFTFTITRDDSLDRVEQLKIAVNKLKTEFQNVLFVGNSENDFSAAKEVGCQFSRVTI